MCLRGFFMCVLLVASLVYGQRPNNVCPTFQDYETIGTNKRCWYNPDVNAKPEAIAKRYGFTLEAHDILTPDGYILELNRLVSPNRTAGNLPVLIHHGICARAVIWMLHGKTSIPFYLASVGYDVWLSNARGTEPSMRHVNMTIDDPKFWDYSFHEIALLDIPVTMEYIRKKRNGKKVIFVGHSMGGTTQYVYASMMPDHAKENVRALISIAPVVYTENMKASPALLLVPYVKFLTEELSMVEFYGSGKYPQLTQILKNLCGGYPYITACYQLQVSFTGISEHNLEPEVLPLFFKRYPASFSAKTLSHFGQEIASGGRFQMFDYGLEENLLRYKSMIPPTYDLKKVNVPVYIIFGEADLLSTREDNLKLYESLRTEKFIKAFSGANGNVTFQHNDFQFSKHLHEFDRYLLQIIEDIHRKDEMNSDTNKSKRLWCFSFISYHQNPPSCIQLIAHPG